MISMHRHNDLEINVVLRGELRYVFAGRPLVVREGQISLFWAVQPHGLVDSHEAEACWVHVPWTTVMGWGLPDAELSTLLQADPVMTRSPELHHRLEAMITVWLEEYRSSASASIALLEIQAAVRRIIRAGTDPATAVDPSGSPATGTRALAPEHIRHTMAMAQYVREHHREDVGVTDVARAAHLTSSHAMTVFRRSVGVTIGEYLSMCRVAEAQRLLITTTMTAAEIATASGFGSLSSFYHHVTAACGMPPREYRKLAAT
jgi:AraC-like DNA-binding protein